jgi:DNA-binding transcriptional MerR regulator
MSKYPRKLFYKIGEVCELCGVEAHVLRYWESEFPMLSPVRNKSGQRIYRQRDLEIIDSIKRLLYQEGYTISGASRQLLEQGLGSGQEFPLFRRRQVTKSEAVAEIREALKEILAILDRPVQSQPPAPATEKQPVAPVPHGTQLTMPVLLTDVPQEKP